MRYYLIQDNDIHLIYDDKDLGNPVNYSAETKAIKEDLEQCQELGTVFYVTDSVDDNRPICGITAREAIEKHLDIKDFILIEIHS